MIPHESPTVHRSRKSKKRECSKVCSPHGNTSAQSSDELQSSRPSNDKRSSRKSKRARTVRRSGRIGRHDTMVLGKQPIDDNAMQAIDDFVEKSCAAGVEGIKHEFEAMKAYIAPSFEHNHFSANGEKNRFKDVVCLDATRVILTLNVPPEHDYVHANWIKLSGVGHIFIAAQGPMESTISDFWRMIYQEEAKTILMLTKTVEEGKTRCAQYWPPESGAYKTYGSMFVNNRRVEKEDKFIISTIEVLPEGCSNSVILKLVQMTDWPDRGVPESGMSVLRMLKLIQPGGPCVVHCSAGIGRTGVVIFVEACIQRLCKGYRLNMPEMLKELRNQRASCIQTEGQYVFVHLTVLYYISAKLPKHREAVAKFHDAFKAAKLS